MVENFTLKTLRHLAQHGLQSNTAGIFRPGRKENIPSDCICFPWLIVEHKRDEKGENQCHCQAANAGAAAVMMLEELSCLIPAEIEGEEGEGIPPVVTMTTVDKIVRVWITYRLENYTCPCIGDCDCPWEKIVSRHATPLSSTESIHCI